MNIDAWQWQREHKKIKKKIGFCPSAPIRRQKRLFYSPVWPTINTYLVKTVTQNASFQKRSPEWRFLKTLASRLRLDGRNVRFWNTMMSYIIYFQHDACTVSDAIVFPSFQRFRVNGRKRFEYAMCEGVYFLKTEKKSPFTKISGYVWTGP